MTVRRGGKATGREGTWAGCARWLGFDGNPLRRRTDRIEAVIRLAIMILLVVAMPIAAVAAGQQADHLAQRQAHAQRAANHLVDAILLQQAPTTGSPDPYTSVQTVWVLARWRPPGLPTRTGEVVAVAGAHQGSIVRTWINASGAVADPPLDHRDIVGEVFIAVIATCLASWLVLLASSVLARRALDCRRLSGWDAAWRASEPLWSGRYR